MLDILNTHTTFQKFVRHPNYSTVLSELYETYRVSKKNVPLWFPGFARLHKQFHKCKHSIVVGHGTGFHLHHWGSELETDPYHFSDNRSPLLKVLLICPLGILSIHDIRQDIVKLVDLHKKLTFALPTLRPIDFVEEPELFEVKQRKLG